jgi:hypothetical protein
MSSCFFPGIDSFYLVSLLQVAWTISSEIGNGELDFVPVGLWRSNDVRMHICEVQLILKSTYDVKAAGGHDKFVEVRNLISA